MPTEEQLIEEIRTHVTGLLGAAHTVEHWDGALRRQKTAIRDARVQAAEATHAEVVAKAQAERDTAIRAADAEHAKRVAANERMHAEAMETAAQRYTETHEREKAATNEMLFSLYDSPIAWRAEAWWDSGVWDPTNDGWWRIGMWDSTSAEGGTADLMQAYRDGNHPLADPEHPYWAEPLTAREANGIPAFLRIGHLWDDVRGETWGRPALLPFPGERPILIKAGAARREAAVGAVQSLILRALAAFPQGKLQITCLDPVGHGDNFSPFMFLADYDPRLVNSRAWAEPRQMEEQLAKLTENMETVLQVYLRRQYPTLAAYNEQAGEVAEPYRLLVAFDFPTNFSEAAANRLISLAQSGARCGIYTIIVVDTDKPLPHNVSLAALEREAILIEETAEGFVWRDPEEVFSGCTLALDEPPNLVLAEERDTTTFGRILMSVGAGAKATRDVKVPMEKLYTLFRNQLAVVNEPDPRVSRTVRLEDEATWWQGKTEKGIVVPLGQEGARGALTLDLGKGDNHHVLIAGRIGSGKSVLFQAMVMNTALLYSPEEVHLYLIDLKEGVTFKTFAKHSLPHARVVAIKSEREYALSVLEELDRILERRGDAFRAVNAQNIAEYHDHLKAPEYAHIEPQPMPRILLMVDEFQELFTENDRIGNEAARILSHLVLQGRSNGINVILGSQTLAGSSTLPPATFRQMGVRIALMSAEADSRYILADDNTEARQLTRPGQAIYNAENGRVEGNHRFQVVYLEDDERDRYLVRVRAKADAAGDTARQTIFEGDAPADLPANLLLAHRIAGGSPPAERRPAMRAWLGEPIAIEDPVAAPFRRDQARNLLIVGQDSDTTRALMAAAIISLAAQAPRGRADSIALLDFSPGDIEEADYLLGLLNRVYPGAASGERPETPAIIGDLYAEVMRRIAQNTKREPSRFLLIYDIQRARDLRQDEAARVGPARSRIGNGGPPAPVSAPVVAANGGPEEAFGLPTFQIGSRPAPGVVPTAGRAPESNARETIQQLAALLREGPEYGVHVIATCESVPSAGRVFDRQTLGDFALRVALQMPQNDSSAFVESPAANLLGPLRAILFDREESRHKKFRPYAQPPEEWLASVETALAR